MQASVHQEENREADKLRRFRSCGDVSKQAGMSSGALINPPEKKKKNPVYINAEMKNTQDFLFQKISFERKATVLKS